MRAPSRVSCAALLLAVLLPGAAFGQEYDPSDVDAYDVEEPSFLCTQDCSGHEAGFQWAQENDLTETYQCGGDSQSFIEGCEGFVQQRAEQAEEEAEEQAQMIEDGDCDDEDEDGICD